MPRIQLRWLAHARSGDKGDTANVGLIALDPAWYPLLRRVLAAGVKVKAYDPAVMADDGRLARTYPDLDVELMSDPYAAAEGASVMAIMTEWDEFVELDFDKMAEIMARRSIVDARNLLEPTIPRRRGFVYRGVGR